MHIFGDRVQNILTAKKYGNDNFFLEIVIKIVRSFCSCFVIY